MIGPLGHARRLTPAVSGTPPTRFGPLRPLTGLKEMDQSVHLPSAAPASRAAALT